MESSHRARDPSRERLAVRRNPRRLQCWDHCVGPWPLQIHFYIMCWHRADNEDFYYPLSCCRWWGHYLPFRDQTVSGGDLLLPHKLLVCTSSILTSAIEEISGAGARGFSPPAFTLFKRSSWSPPLPTHPRQQPGKTKAAPLLTN